METITFNGRITDRGGGLPGSLTIAAAVEIVAGVGKARALFELHHFESLYGGEFAFTQAIPEDVIDKLRHSEYRETIVGSIGISLQVFTQESVRIEREWSAVAFESLGQSFSEQVSSVISPLTLDLDLTRMELVSVGITLSDDDVTETNLERVDRMTFEFSRPSSSAFGLTIDAERLFRAPALRRGRDFVSRIAVSPGYFEVDQDFVRFFGAGTYYDKELIVRTQALRKAPGASNWDHWGYLRRVEEATSESDLNRDLSDGSFKFPFQVSDMRLESGHRAMMLTARVGIAVSEELSIAPLGRLEAKFSARFRNFEQRAFEESELSKLVLVDLDVIEYDLRPDSDLDDLPLAVYAALTAVSPGTSVRAAILTGLEALVTPIVESVAKKQITLEITKRIRSAFEKEREDARELLVDTALAAGIELSESDIGDVLMALWFEGEKIDISTDGLVALGWAGIWHYESAKASDAVDSCPFNGNEDDQEGLEAVPGEIEGNVPKSDMIKLKRVDRALKDERLAHWRESYLGHRGEIGRIVQTVPEQFGLLVGLAEALEPLVASSKQGSVLDRKSADLFEEIVRGTLQRGLSAPLAMFLLSALRVVRAGVGLNLEELLDLAGNELPPPLVDGVRFKSS